MIEQKNEIFVKAKLLFTETAWKQTVEELDPGSEAFTNLKTLLQKAKKLGAPVQFYGGLGLPGMTVAMPRPIQIQRSTTVGKVVEDITEFLIARERVSGFDALAKEFS